jgi:hypothetical protein
LLLNCLPLPFGQPNQTTVSFGIGAWVVIGLLQATMEYAGRDCSYLRAPMAGRTGVAIRGGLHYALPPELRVGPDWLVLVLVAALAIPATISHHRGNWRLSHVLGYAANSVVTLSVAISLALLISRLPMHKDRPRQLLRSAGALWVCMLVFACWYWRLDAGGPHQRALRRSHTDGASLFPQMLMDPDLRKEMGEDQWSPGFVDYLFLAFNTSTAFSPTDVPVLSHWAKTL